MSKATGEVIAWGTETLSGPKGWACPDPVCEVAYRLLAKEPVRAVREGTGTRWSNGVSWCVVCGRVVNATNRVEE